MPETGGEIAITAFTASMLLQTFEGLMQALITQCERNAEITRESTLMPGEFAEEYITPEMARDELFIRFGETEDGTSRVDAGQPYTPPGVDTPEDPPIFKICGVEFGTDDYIRNRPAGKISDGRAFLYKISEKGAQRVADAIVDQLARTTIDKLRMLVRLGLPEIKVESGRILTKASFRVESSTQNSYGTEKMLIRALNLSGPEGFKSRVGMSGEMEVKFSVVRSEWNG